MMVFRMNKKYKIATLVIILAGLLAGSIWYLHGLNFAVLNPKGTIGEQERHLIVFASLLSLVVVVPVFILLFGIIWKYRVGNTKTKAKYTPDWDHSTTLETIWWIIPSLLIVVLSVVTWTSSHKLDPYKPLASSVKPLKVEVVALDWKWLFIYPDLNIATVNWLQIPVDTPVDLEITADAPMNSLWIPQLGGQVYAMPGMSTELHLQASATGDYKGSSANISGKGFSGMAFTTRASQQGDFDQWVEQARRSPNVLSQSGYASLARPSENNKPQTFSTIQANLYDTILMKYMTMPAVHQHKDISDSHHEHDEQTMTNTHNMNMGM